MKLQSSVIYNFATFSLDLSTCKNQEVSVHSGTWVFKELTMFSFHVHYQCCQLFLSLPCLLFGWRQRSFTSILFWHLGKVCLQTIPLAINRTFFQDRINTCHINKMTFPGPSFHQTAREFTHLTSLRFRCPTDSLNAILYTTYILMTYYNKTLLKLQSVVLSCTQCTFLSHFTFLRKESRITRSPHCTHTHTHTHLWLEGCTIGN